MDGRGGKQERGSSGNMAHSSHWKGFLVKEGGGQRALGRGRWETLIKLNEVLRVVA